MDIKELFTPFPSLTTSRLILRALRSDDLDDLFAYASDPDKAFALLKRKLLKFCSVYGPPRFQG